jgi:hypothetical protein
MYDLSELPEAASSPARSALRSAFRSDAHLHCLGPRDEFISRRNGLHGAAEARGHALGDEVSQIRHRRKAPAREHVVAATLSSDHRRGGGRSGQLGCGEPPGSLEVQSRFGPSWGRLVRSGAAKGLWARSSAHPRG